MSIRKIKPGRRLAPTKRKMFESPRVERFFFHLSMGLLFGTHVGAYIINGLYIYSVGLRNFFWYFLPLFFAVFLSFYIVKQYMTLRTSDEEKSLFLSRLPRGLQKFPSLWRIYYFFMGVGSVVAMSCAIPFALYSNLTVVAKIFTYLGDPFEYSVQLRGVGVNNHVQRGARDMSFFDHHGIGKIRANIDKDDIDYPEYRDIKVGIYDLRDVYVCIKGYKLSWALSITHVSPPENCNQRNRNDG